MWNWDKREKIHTARAEGEVLVSVEPVERGYEWSGSVRLPGKGFLFLGSGVTKTYDEAVAKAEGLL